MKMTMKLIVISSLALLIFGCRNTQPTSPQPSEVKPLPPAPPSATTSATPLTVPDTLAAKHPVPAAKSSAPIVTMVTNKGTILIKLFPKQAPISCANFEKLIKKGFYNGLTFHRVADLEGQEGSGQGHIVQGGDPSGNGTGGPGYTIKGEFPANGVANPLKHQAGAVAMARETAPDSAGSQFYIVVTPAPHLDGNYAVFGQVIKGLDVAGQLQVGDTMTKVTVKG